MNLFEKYRAKLKDLTPADRAMDEKVLKPVREAEKVIPSNVCPACQEYAWWESTYGCLVCGVCHPPARPDLIRRWIGDPERYARLKASRPSVVLSYEECRRRKEARTA